MLRPDDVSGRILSRSWLISLQKVKSEELKRLVMLLLMDATAMHFLALPEVPLRGGF